MHNHDELEDLDGVPVDYDRFEYHFSIVYTGKCSRIDSTRCPEVSLAMDLSEQKQETEETIKEKEDSILTETAAFRHGF